MTGQKNPCETCSLAKNSEYRQRGLCRCPEWKKYFRAEWKGVTLSLIEHQEVIKHINISEAVKE